MWLSMELSSSVLVALVDLHSVLYIFTSAGVSVNCSRVAVSSDSRFLTLVVRTSTC